MRRILVLTSILLVASVAALELRGQSGYLLLRLNEWTIETSPSFALITLLTLFLLLQGLIHLLLRFIHSPRDLKQWSQRQRVKRSQKQLTLGLITLAEGEWKKAELLLSKSAEHSETPLMHYLGAANAAQKQNSDERRDHYLQQAHQEVPKADFVIRLTQAEQLVSQQQFSEALEILNPLREERSNHPKLLQLLAQSLSALQQWKALLQLIPRLRKTEEVDLDELNQLELLAENHLLTQSADKGGKGALQKQWKLLSRRQRHQPELVYHYATLLIRAGEKESAETLLRKEIQHQWSEQLVTLYGSFSTDTPDQQIHIAEKWLEQHADSAALQLTLGRLLMQEQVWGAAQQHLERSLKIHPSSAVYQALAQLMKQNQDLAAALHYYEAEVALLRGKTEPPHSTAISVVTDYDSLPSEAPATSNESK